MADLRIGSLFSGYGGLEQGVEAVLGGSTAWVSDIDKGACKILAHRYPGVPNLGDITTVDWAQVEPVDVLTGGSPCQDLSHAGKRGGMTEGTRSNLWVAMREAIAQLRPSIVVWENVRGAYSAGADSDLEFCPGCMGEAWDRGPVLRALHRVIGDLSDLGYVGGWHGLRAADVGAPHGRFRVFVVATLGDSAKSAWRGPQQQHLRAATGQAAEPGEPVGATARLLPTPTSSDTNGPGAHGDGGVDLRTAISLLGTPRASEWKGSGPVGSKSHAHMIGREYLSAQVLSIEAQRLLPTPRAGDYAASGGSTTSDVTLTDAIVRTNLGAKENPRHAVSTEGRPGEELPVVREAIDTQAVRKRQTRGQDGFPQETELLAELREQSVRGDAVGSSVPGQAAPKAYVRDVRDDEPSARSPQGPELAERRPREPADLVRFVPSETALAGGPSSAPGCCEAGSRDGGCPLGIYSAAVHRWEMVLGRVAPPATVASKKGTPQLNAAFSEFLMGLPAGWVTDVPGITRNEALKALGNGVVPQQAEAALRFLLGGQSIPAPDTRELFPTPSAADGMGGHLNRSGARSGELLLPGVAKALANGGAA